MIGGYQIIGPFKQLLPMTDLPIKGALGDDQLRVISDAGILVKSGRVSHFGDFNQLIKSSKSLNLQIVELKGDIVGLPGLIDAHTHICFGGTRARDYAMRNAGSSYLEIAKAGGGIWDTVTQTRKESIESLTAGVIRRANQLLISGVTTAEVKSGYGLSVSEELKMLRAIQRADSQVDIDLIATCLAAHIFPKDYDGSIADYLLEISLNLFPIIKKEGLSNRVDAFIEEEAFSSTLIATYLSEAQKMGFDITIHADQFHTGGSQVAVDFDARSADHLEASTDKEIELLSRSNVVAVALPGATMGLGCAFTPARKLLDAGASLAIASDWNPGSAPMGDLLLQAAVLGSFEKLSNAEVLAGITCRAANALNVQEIGSLAKKNKADVIGFQTDNYQEILYQQGRLRPSMVWKNGIQVV